MTWVAIIPELLFGDPSPTERLCTVCYLPSLLAVASWWTTGDGIADNGTHTFCGDCGLLQG